MNSRSRIFLEAMEAYNRDDNVTALRLMETAAEQDDPVACFHAAFWHAGREEGFPVDPARSKHWLGKLEDLAEGDNAEAQWELGMHIRFGNLQSQNTELANYWLERAAENGYGEAQHHLAWYLETGQYGYPVDLDGAQSWYSRAFEREHPETLYLFAIRQFIDGRPTEEALRLLRKAADTGFKQADYVLKTYTH
jgi:TPR repeat protein